MPKSLRLTRRYPAAMTEEAHRVLRRVARDSGLSHDMVITFLLQELDHITDRDRFIHRLRLFAAEHAQEET
ncbi:hypothetical protein DDZ14_11420 [Maritimibacter sp. 55A14]|uniref:hypothetical protein n=1 Tax=Maritimibacter sp. 55A14 TaxID=2174844 RepID=UPI000D606AD3|nr:hypothetical protein [Maritimibacter sp. 55A14]PWE32328.1 hypothetical protein DDZ14_11420 [Maritimibacter sp. 55A14]